MKKISIIVPGHPSPFEIYFSDDVLKSLAPLPPTGQEDTFLFDIALALLAKTGTQHLNYFYVHRIRGFQSEPALTHELLIADYFGNCITPNFGIHLDNKIGEAKAIEIATISDFSNLETMTGWKKLLSLIANYTKYDEEAITAYKQGRVAPPAPFLPPFKLAKQDDEKPTLHPALKIKFDPAEASKLFQLSSAQVDDIKAAHKQRNGVLRYYQNQIGQNRIKLESILKHAHENSVDYDPRELAAFAQSEIEKANIEQHHAVITAILNKEEERINHSPAHEALDMLLSNQNKPGETKSYIYENIYRRFIDHESYATPFRLIKTTLIWAIKEAARQYYQEYLNDVNNTGKVRAEISSWKSLNLYSWTPAIIRTATTLEECEQYLEIKRLHFNERFNCVAIQITPCGQFVTYIDEPADGESPATRVTIEELFANADLAKLQQFIRTLLINCNKAMYGQATSHKKITDCLNEFNSIMADIHWNLFTANLFAAPTATEAAQSTLAAYKPTGINEDYEKLPSTLFHYTDVKASMNPMSLNNLYVLKNLGGNIEFTWDEALYQFEQTAKKYCAEFITAITGGVEVPGLVQLIVDDILTNTKAREDFAKATRTLDEITQIISRIEKNIEIRKNLLMLQRKSDLPVKLVNDVSISKIPALVQQNETVISALEQVKSTLAEDTLRALRANATCLQEKARLVAANAKKTLDEIEKVQKQMVAKTIEIAGNDLLHMDTFKKQADEQLKIAEDYTAAINAIQKFMIIHAEEEAKIKEFEREIFNMLPASNAKQSIPTHVTSLQETVKGQKEEFARSLSHATRKIDELTEILAKENHSSEIMSFTREITRTTEELRDATQAIERNMKPAREKVAANSRNHQTHIELLDLIIPIVKNLAFWKSLSSGGETVKGDDGNDYKVPVGIAAMFNDIKTMSKIDYKTNPLHPVELYKTDPLHAEEFYTKLRDTTNSRNGTSSSSAFGLFGGRNDVTTNFYQAVSTKENDKKAALNTWIFANKTQLEKASSANLRKVS